MEDASVGPLLAELPEPVGRKLRLGPFPSAVDALKFVTYAAVGAVLASITSPWVWVPAIVLGFAFSMVRVDGRPLDAEVAAALRWRLFPARGVPLNDARRGSRDLTRDVLRLSGDRHVALIRVIGGPIAYLPPAEMAQRFERFRKLLRSWNRPFSLRVSSDPMHPGPVAPGQLPDTGLDREATIGYSELVALLCRRRSVRRVELLVDVPGASPIEMTRSRAQIDSLLGGLASLGLQAAVLRGASLDAAAHRWGWPVARGPP